jgi:Ser/Thr protein kinase RdoA (MazF antagonist)
MQLSVCRCGSGSDLVASPRFDDKSVHRISDARKPKNMAIKKSFGRQGARQHLLVELTDWVGDNQALLHRQLRPSGLQITLAPVK